MRERAVSCDRWAQVYCGGAVCAWGSVLYVLCTCVHASVSTYMRACVRACVRTCVHACVHPCVYTCVHTYVCAVQVLSVHYVFGVTNAVCVAICAEWGSSLRGLSLDGVELALSH